MRVAILGEPLLELSHPTADTTKLAYGGDTLNTAVYLARLGHAPAYLTALGTDPYSDRLLESWQAEGIQTGHVLRHPHRIPGLYAIRTDADGERSFFYWRGESAVRKAFELDGWGDVMDWARKADCLYLSGISLSIFSDEERAALVDLAAAARAGGGHVAFDPNYRARGWRDVSEARHWIAAFGAHVSLALPTREDEDALFDVADPAEHAGRWLEWGVDQVVVKCGAQGAWLFGETGGRSGDQVPVETVVQPLDTTGAGDSFNAGYLSAHLKGRDAVSAARTGHRLAAQVIQHAGAILPSQNMPQGLWD